MRVVVYRLDSSDLRSQSRIDAGCRLPRAAGQKNEQNNKPDFHI
jgi:hypothetical protein